jgi:hypothetical protein
MLPDRELHLLSKTISWTPKDSMRVEMGGFLPRTRRRSVHDSWNLSRAPAASLVIGFAAP